jgi:hypothetical protein
MGEVWLGGKLAGRAECLLLPAELLVRHVDSVATVVVYVTWVCNMSSSTDHYATEASTVQRTHRPTDTHIPPS